MKVIEEGKDWNLEKRCTGSGNGGGGCNALLGISIYDIYLTHNYDYGGGHDIFYTFKCPCCQVETDLNESEVPRIVKNRLLNNYWASKRG